MARLHRWKSGKGGSYAAHHHEHKGLCDCSLDVKDSDDEDDSSNPIIFVVLSDGNVCSRTPPTWSLSTENAEYFTKKKERADVTFCGQVMGREKVIKLVILRTKETFLVLD